MKFIVQVTLKGDMHFLKDDGTKHIVNGVHLSVKEKENEVVIYYDEDALSLKKNEALHVLSPFECDIKVLDYEEFTKEALDNLVKKEANRKDPLNDVPEFDVRKEIKSKK